MRNRRRASKSKRGKNAYNAGAFGGQKFIMETRVARVRKRKELEEAQRREIRNAKRRERRALQKASDR